MLRKLTDRLVVRSVEVVWFWGALPLRWNKPSGRLEIIKTKWRQFLYLFNILGQLLNLSYLNLRYVQLYFRPSVPSTLTLYLEFVLLCYNYGVLYHTVLYLCLDDIVDFINGYRQLFTAMPRRFKTNLKVSRWCDILLAQLVIFGHLALGLNLVTLLRCPQNIVYFTSLLDNPQGLGLVGKIPFAAVYVYIWWSMWSLIHPHPHYGLCLCTRWRSKIPLAGREGNGRTAIVSKYASYIPEIGRYMYGICKTS